VDFHEADFPPLTVDSDDYDDDDGEGDDALLDLSLVE